MKKQYIRPITQVMAFEEESLMITASPGVGEGFDPDISIEAKKGGSFDWCEREWAAENDDAYGSSDFKLTKNNNLWD